MPDRQKSENTTDLELRALHRMINARCEQIERLVRQASSRGELTSRESGFQFQAFAERRTKALRQLESAVDEPSAIRIARLEALVEALECSWAYFRSKGADSNASDDVREWGILVK